MTPSEAREEVRPWLRGDVLAVLLVLTCLLMPSVCMLAKVPPLWRDADAYHQLVPPPAQAVAGGHGLLYCVASRLPLYAGYRFERFLGKQAPQSENFFQHPRLTDSGIFLLLVAQHLALAGAALFLIVTATNRPWLRVALALFFASQPLFYTFAQCVGSESLSLICLLFFATVGWRLVKSESPARRLWILVGIALYLSFLTRHANLFLVLAAPIGFLSAALRRGRADLLRALLALLLGLGCLEASRLTNYLVCRLDGRSVYSKIGFTFLWHYSFLEKVPEPRRTELLERATARAKSEDAKQVILVVRELLQEGTPLRSDQIVARLRTRLFPPATKPAARRIHQALNQAAAAFLLPPSAEHWEGAREEFASACHLPLPVMSTFLFRTTAYYFDHQAELPKCAPLVTFRDYTRESLEAIPARNCYFQLWKFLTLEHCLFGFLVSTIALMLWSQRERPEFLIVGVYGFALVLSVTLMVAATALIGELLPRYTLPLWEMIWISLIIYAGAIGEKGPPGGGERWLRKPGGPSSIPDGISRPGEARESP